MKKPLVLFSALALMGLLALTGCSGVLSPAQILNGQGTDAPAAAVPDGTGTVEIQIGGVGGARTLAPVSVPFEEYEVYVDGEKYTTITTASTILHLAGATSSSGTNYALYVVGLIGKAPVAQSVSKAINVIEGRTQTVNLVLSEPPDQNAKGTFEFAVQFPAILKDFTPVSGIPNYSKIDLTGSSRDYYQKASLTLKPISTPNQGDVWIAAILNLPDL
ncbi:hypothetical protein AGMMS4952_27970 [Spirochaetia bacterium]|nr:hypothetical protein AGMMS4952_27970 [Spirochaetia bacterium]